MGRSKSKPYNEQFLTGAEAANLLGVTDRSIRTWAADPKKAIARNKDQKYGLISLLFAQLEEAKNSQKDLSTARAELAIAQTRKTKIECEIKELERDRAAEKLLDAEEVQKVWIDHQMRIKARLLTLHRKLPMELAGEVPSEVANNLSPEQRDSMLSLWQERIKSEVYAILNELAQEEVDGDDSGDTGEE